MMETPRYSPLQLSIGFWKVSLRSYPEIAEQFPRWAMFVCDFKAWHREGYVISSQPQTRAESLAEGERREGHSDGGRTQKPEFKRVCLSVWRRSWGEERESGTNVHWPSFRLRRSGEEKREWWVKGRRRDHTDRMQVQDSQYQQNNEWKDLHRLQHPWDDHGGKEKMMGVCVMGREKRDSRDAFLDGEVKLAQIWHTQQVHAKVWDTSRIGGCWYRFD